HPDLAGAPAGQPLGHAGGAGDDGAARDHGTFVAGILSARRGAMAPAICPGCTLLSRPLFRDGGPRGYGAPSATPRALAEAVRDCIDAGARVVNISAAVAGTAIQAEPVLQGALDGAARRDVIVVAAAGNRRSVGGTVVTSHPWVIPVMGYDGRGRPLGHTNLGGAIGRRGLGGPGDRVLSLGADGGPLTMSGSSAAAPFVTGAIALLWSEAPRASATQVKLAVTGASTPRRATVVPPLLDAWAAYRAMKG
ncbi:MAG TPA: S8 family serine peptidase, partial [Vicinamibacteria bacterium]